MSTTFSGKVALVAGGTGGLGRAVSLAFLEAGASVAATYRNRQELAALEAAVRANASRLDEYEVDATAGPAVQKLVETIRVRHGRLDVLVNTIGGYAGGMTLWEQEVSHLDRMLDLNLRAGFVLLRAVVPVMLEQGSGAIVNVAARAALDHGPQLAAYAASKAAAIAMVDSLAADLKGTGVRANSILPSIIDTEANRKAMPAADFSRWTRPEDIAKVVLFLCSDDARVIRGAAVPVYGDS